MLQLIRLSYNAIGFSLNLKTAKLGEDAAFRYMNKPCVLFFYKYGCGCAQKLVYLPHTYFPGGSGERGGGGRRGVTRPCA